MPILLNHLGQRTLSDGILLGADGAPCCCDKDKKYEEGVECPQCTVLPPRFISVSFGGRAYRGCRYKAGVDGEWPDGPAWLRNVVAPIPGFVPPAQIGVSWFTDINHTVILEQDIFWVGEGEERAWYGDPCRYIATDNTAVFLNLYNTEAKCLADDPDHDARYTAPEQVEYIYDPFADSWRLTHSATRGFNGGWEPSSGFWGHSDGYGCPRPGAAIIIGNNYHEGDSYRSCLVDGIAIITPVPL